MRIARNALDLIGNTPLVSINKLTGRDDASVYAGAEFLNPSGSVKDEMIYFIIDNAERTGALKPGQTIVEASTGNTGIAVAMVSAVKGYKAIIVMPKTSIKKNKRQIIEMYGARVIDVPVKEGVIGVVKKAKEIAKDKKAFFVNQFSNPHNPIAHEVDTGKDILKATNNRVDTFVASIGTGGTLIGIAKALKRERLKTRIIAVEPENSPVFYNHFYGNPEKKVRGIGHIIEGIGEGFVPQILEEDKSLIDEVVLVSDENAINTARDLASKEGLFVGPSSGANIYVALKEARRLGSGKIVVTVLPDSGQRYLGTAVFK